MASRMPTLARTNNVNDARRAAALLRSLRSRVTAKRNTVGSVALLVRDGASSSPTD
jgi:hypothetical protein